MIPAASTRRLSGRQHCYTNLQTYLYLSTNVGNYSLYGSQTKQSDELAAQHQTWIALATSTQEPN